MKKLKYIIVNGSPVLFTEDISHDTFRHLKPTSAGFVNIYMDETLKVSAFGESISLGLKSDPNDSDLISRRLTSPW